MAAQSKSGGGGKKRGRDRVKCKRYRDRGTRERNKTSKLKEHIKRHPGDDVAKVALRHIAPRNTWNPGGGML